MLERIEISGFAVARSVVIEPGPGLNVFTGETGAGKSLIVDALAFLFGGRRGREVIATGADRATVEALLRLPSGPLTVSRTIGLAGRSTARVGDAPATIDQLQSLASAMVDIHGQSEQLAILRPAVQLDVLDEFAGLLGKRAELAELVRELREVRRDMRSLATDARERERLIDQLRFEAEEIAEAAPVPGEDDALRQEQARLANASRLLEDVARALEVLESSPLADALAAVHDLVDRDPSADELADITALLETGLVDLSRALRDYRDRLEEDPERLEAIDERLDRLARLRRKYGETLADVIAYGEQATARLSSLTSVDVSIEGLESRERELLARLGPLAMELSRARRAAAGELVRAIAAELEHLGMGGAALAVGFAVSDDPEGPPAALPDYELVDDTGSLAGDGEEVYRACSETGVDRIEFLASFNPGEAPRPLSAVASGGETSRFLLALTTVLGASGEPRLIVLDEADEGVGGRAGALVGDALARLSQRHQVLCITHLPQVAAYGDHHFVVTKHTDGNRSWSEVRTVGGDDRIEELASMLGGVSDATREAATEMLASSRS